MLRREIKYMNFNEPPEEETEVFYFHLSANELVEWELSANGGLEKLFERLIEEKDSREIYNVIKEILLKAYGKRSEDGKRFMKSDELRKEFEQHAAFSSLIVEFMTHEDAAAKFFDALVPDEVKNIKADQDKPKGPPQIGDTRPAPVK